jgi:M6 family metalloprotease-like protein
MTFRRTRSFLLLAAAAIALLAAPVVAADVPDPDGKPADTSVQTPTVSGQAPTVPIPALDSKGEVYKTEGVNDPLIYDSTVGHKKVIMLYVDFSDAVMKIDTPERAKSVLGNGKFQELFHEQSYGKVTFEFKHIDGWRRLSKSYKKYSSKTTDAHRELFVEIFGLYPKVDFLAYDYIMVNMPRIGNTAFGERDDIAIPYRGKKINVALNISSGSPYVLAHETGHLMGLPDLYSYGNAKGPKNPVGAWDIMSSAGKASGFLGWQRHKLNWLDADRKTYIVSGKYRFKLMPLNASSGVSMITVPVDDPVKPSKVFVVEVSQPIRNKGEVQDSVGVLVYSVDAKIASGQNSVVVYPKTDPLNAPFQPGDQFEHKDAPLKMKVLKKNEDGRSYIVEVEVK